MSVAPRTGLFTDEESLVMRSAFRIGGADLVSAMLPERRPLARDDGLGSETLREILKLAVQYNIAQRAWIVAYHHEGLQTTGDVLTVLRLYHSERNSWQPVPAGQRTPEEQQMFDAAMYYDMPKVLLGYVDEPPQPSAPEPKKRAVSGKLTNEKVAAMDTAERTERRGNLVERICLCCGHRKFMSEGPHERMCFRCRGRDVAPWQNDTVIESKGGIA